MTDRVFTPPRFAVRKDGSFFRVWDHDRSRFQPGPLYQTKRGAERKADNLNALELKRKSREPKTRFEKLRNLNYAGDPAPIRQYKD